VIAAEQARAFLVMALCGFGCGAAYDAMMLLRHLAGTGAVVGGAMDLAFGVVPAAGMTAAALFLRTDPFRLYAFAGVGLGMLIWFATLGLLGRRIIGVCRKIVLKKAKKVGKEPR